MKKRYYGSEVYLINKNYRCKMLYFVLNLAVIIITWYVMVVVFKGSITYITSILGFIYIASMIRLVIVYTDKEDRNNFPWQERKRLLKDLHKAMYELEKRSRAKKHTFHYEFELN